LPINCSVVDHGKKNKKIRKQRCYVLKESYSKQGKGQSR